MWSKKIEVKGLELHIDGVKLVPETPLKNMRRIKKADTLIKFNIVIVAVNTLELHSSFPSSSLYSNLDTSRYTYAADRKAV